MDKSQEICSRLWRWFVELRDSEKTDRVWDRMIDQAIKITKEYQDDPVNHKLALDVCLAFQFHIERLEKQKNELEDLPKY